MDHINTHNKHNMGHINMHTKQNMDHMYVHNAQNMDHMYVHNKHNMIKLICIICLMEKCAFPFFQRFFPGPFDFRSFVC